MNSMMGFARLSTGNSYYHVINTYLHHRFPPDIISCAVWLYYRFNLRRVVTVIEVVPDHSLKICSLNAL